MTTRYVTINSKKALHPGDVFDDHELAGYSSDTFWGKANSIYLPIGKEPGVAYFLLTTAAKDGILTTAANSITWVDGASSTSFKGWYLVDSRCAGVDGDSKAPWIVELRDVRQLMIGGGTISKHYNVTCPSWPKADVEQRRYETDSLNAGSPWTWQEMFDDVWNTLPSEALTAPTLPWTPTHTPQSWTFNAEDSWDAIHKILDSCQSAIAVDYSTGNMTVVSLGDTQDVSFLDDGVLIVDEKPTADLNKTDAPATWVIAFPRRQVDLLEPNAPHTIEVASTISGGTGKRVLRSDLYADWKRGTAGFRNTADLTAAASELAARADKRKDLSGDPRHQYFSGIVAGSPGEQVHALLWRDYGDDDDGLLTEVIAEATWGEPTSSGQAFVDNVANPMYVAKVPQAGIPGRSGTRLGKATCEIWRSEPPAAGSTIRDLVPNVLHSGQTQTEVIYNLSLPRIEEGYYKVDQDAFSETLYIDCCGAEGSSASSSSVASSSIPSSSESSISSESSCECPDFSDLVFEQGPGCYDVYYNCGTGAFKTVLEGGDPPTGDGWVFCDVVCDSSISSVSSSSSSSSSESSESSQSLSSISGSESESLSDSVSDSGSGSDKSSAIVPASWSPTGYTALFIAEMPDVRFDDVLIASATGQETLVPIDKRFIEVCARGTIRVCGCVPSGPVLVGAEVVDGSVRIVKEDMRPVIVVIRLTGIRRGFKNHRFPDRTREQFVANEAFINSAYPGAGS